MRHILILLICCLASVSAQAIGVDKDRLKDPVQEARAQEIMKQLRCLVCQNQSIVESDASLAQDLRAIVREQVKAGKTEAEILEFMTARYGDWVLLKPPVRGSTLVLWFGPLILLLGGGLLVIRYVRQRPETAQPSPLNAEEAEKLKKILAGEDK
ncbi:cytochrome c-type biogenesis protein [Paremcibacter congregatus]|uniref:Cytochrome c-type biogenesis protein n=1 Tax=Paremcibacter congregatus TaxID=2043170 RepID=A0A2G4YQB1_9PROT|nr:cytochrome c-type biogenesis protein [Paremcibacter congregatus]PHZ84513.1 cytochrome C biogenesis protein CcmH [Paremcibacter congregatus]QDE28732.1 cytochrome c-type biogenesis protein CcmH [Paremcibacter congregatus]